MIVKNDESKDDAFFVSEKPMREPNKAMMASALMEIKGKFRNMAELAEESEISPATLSRILNKNYDKAVSLENIKKLAKCAPKGSKYDLATLLEINGYVVRKANEHDLQENQQRQEKPKGKAEHKPLTYEQRMNSIMKASLLIALQEHCKSAFTVSDDTSFKETGLIRRMTYPTSNILLTFPDEGNMKWVFILYDGSFSGTVDGGPDAKAKQLAGWLAFVFLQDAWEPNSLREYKMSIVFTSEACYKEFINVIDEAKFYNRFSAILVNPYEYKVLEEHFFYSRTFDDKEKGKYMLLDE